MICSDNQLWSSISRYVGPEAKPSSRAGEPRAALGRRTNPKQSGDQSFDLAHAEA